MIARCLYCKVQIRDCSLPMGGRYITGWYHTGDGHERCRGRTTMARPEPLVHVHCRDHTRKPDASCGRCTVSVQVMAYFHTRDRCMPRRCPWVHVQHGP